MSEFSLIMAFDVDDPEFCRGFEAGRIYALVQDIAGHDEGDVDWGEFFPQTVHASNAEMMIRIADAFDVTVRSEEIGSGFLDVTFGRREA